MDRLAPTHKEITKPNFEEVEKLDRLKENTTSKEETTSSWEETSGESEETESSKFFEDSKALYNDYFGINVPHDDGVVVFQTPPNFVAIDYGKLLSC